MTRVVALVESRMASTRLPGKNLLPILGKPMLARLLERLKRCRMVDELCVATTRDAADDALEALARAEGVACHRGSVDDVLERTLHAATALKADVIVEITGDCPLVDPDIADAAVRRYLKGGVDYVANVLDRLSFPVGFDVQVYSRAALAEVSGLTDDPFDRGNVTPFFYRNPQRYRLLNLFAPPALDRPYRYALTSGRSRVVTAVYGRSTRAAFDAPTSSALTVGTSPCAMPDPSIDYPHSTNASAVRRTVFPCRPDARGHRQVWPDRGINDRGGRV
jgi:spore coat polysaccharide biosynthesis protein SpsF